MYSSLESIFLFRNNPDGLALFVADPPRWNFTTRQNLPNCNQALNNAITFELHAIFKSF